MHPLLAWCWSACLSLTKLSTRESGHNVSTVKTAITKALIEIDSNLPSTLCTIAAPYKTNGLQSIRRDDSGAPIARMWRILAPHSDIRSAAAVQVTYVTNGELAWLDSRYGRRLYSPCASRVTANFHRDE